MGRELRSSSVPGIWVQGERGRKFRVWGGDYSVGSESRLGFGYSGIRKRVRE